MADKVPKNVDEYISSAPGWAKSILRDLRRAIRDAAPQSKESISYRMPYYSQNGRLAYFAVFKNHCSFFWINTRDKKIFAKELESQNVVGSTLHIQKGKKAPIALIKKLVKSRVSNNNAKKKRK